MALKAQGAGASYAVCYAINAGTGAFDTPLITFDQIGSSSVTGHPSLGNVIIDINTTNDEQDTETFFTSYLTKNNAQVVDYVLENDAIISYNSGIDAASKFGVIYYRGANLTDSSRHVYVGRAILSGDTGNRSSAASTPGEIPVQFTMVSGLEVTAASTIFNTDLVTQPAADVTVAATETGSVEYISIA